MPHARQQVREAIGTILSGSVAGLWQHVFETRIKPARRIEPYLMTYVSGETSELTVIHPSSLVLRQMSVNVQAFLRITDDETVEDVADSTASEIEQILTFSALDTQLSSKLKGLELQSSSLDITTDDNDRTYAVLSLDWLVQVMTVEGAPDTLV